MTKTICLNTALSCHSRCFICGRRNNKSHERFFKVPALCIAYAFKCFRIVIRTDSRICGRHYTKTGEIREDQYRLIKTNSKIYSLESAQMFELLSKFVKISNPNLIFEPFKDLNKLEDSHCLKITGWSKEEFIRFSNYIKSFRRSKGREKNEIIALYRYQLKHGVAQSTLALLRENTDQRDISRYLSQIRKAVLKDFVPKFLGIKNKPIEFFYEHQTRTCSEIFGLPYGILVLLLDG